MQNEKQEVLKFVSLVQKRQQLKDNGRMMFFLLTNISVLLVRFLLTSVFISTNKMRDAT